MKLKLKIIAFTWAIAMFLTAPAAHALHSNALEVARQMKERTDSTIDIAKKTVGSFNTDSLAETVVFDNQVDSLDTDSDNDSNDSWDPALLIPIFGIVFGLLIPAAVVVLIAYFICQSSRQKSRDNNEIIRQAIAAGYRLPDSFFRKDRETKYLQSGIVWIGWGVGISLLYLLFHSGRVWLPIGIILFFIGASRLTVYFIRRRDNQREESETGNTDA